MSCTTRGGQGGHKIKPSRGGGAQVATSSEVFLFDLPALGGGWSGGGRGAKSGPTVGVELNRRFDKIISALFEDPSIVKLGFAFHQDLQLLRKCWPQARGFRRMVSLLDVGPLSAQALGRSNSSLSKTCQAWLGKPLDKTECASSWGHRCVVCACFVESRHHLGRPSRVQVQG